MTVPGDVLLELWLLAGRFAVAAHEYDAATSKAAGVGPPLAADAIRRLAAGAQAIVDWVSVQLPEPTFSQRRQT